MITKALLVTLRTEMDAALVAIGERHGVTIKAGNATFSTNEATFKVGIRATDAPAKQVEDWHNNAELLGLNPEWLGCSCTFNDSTKVYKIAGLRAPPRGRVVVLIEWGGKTYQAGISDFIHRAKVQGAPAPAAKGGLTIVGA